MEEIFSNLSTTFASAKTIEKTPIKIGKITQVTKNKDATSNSNQEDFKTISIHPDFIEVIRDPIGKNEFLKLVPRSIDIENLDKRMPNLANKIGSKAGGVFKLLREKEIVVN